MEITIYSHPDGDGRIAYEYEYGTLVVSNDFEGTITEVVIGAAGLRVLGEKLIALAKLFEGGV